MYMIMCDRCRIVVTNEHSDSGPWPDGWGFLGYAWGGYHVCPGCLTSDETPRPEQVMGDAP